MLISMRSQLCEQPRPDRCRWLGERGRPRPQPSASRRRHQSFEMFHRKVNLFQSEASRRDADWRRSRRSRSPKLTATFRLTALAAAAAVLLVSILPLRAADSSPRARVLLDFGWKFRLGDDWGLSERLDKGGANPGPAGR